MMLAINQGRRINLLNGGDSKRLADTPVPVRISCLGLNGVNGSNSLIWLFGQVGCISGVSLRRVCLETGGGVNGQQFRPVIGHFNSRQALAVNSTVARVPAIHIRLSLELFHRHAGGYRQLA